MIQEVQQAKTSVNELKLSDALPSMFEHVLLTQDHQDAYYLSELLILPSEKYIGEQMDVVDPDIIHAVREFVGQEIAKRLQSTFLNVYRRNQSQASNGVFNMEVMGKRQLKNRCLSYLLKLPAHSQVGIQQFENALKSNMTDTLAALSGLVHLESKERVVALDAFYKEWQHDPLCVDKWLALQAGSTLPDTLSHVKQLMKHSAFDIKNPNKVYALIGTFARRNQVRLHAKDGSGYVFLREVVQQLDKLNPILSGRMVEPLTNFKRYDKERQTLMRQQLLILRQDKQLSPDLYELLTKSLN